MSSGKAITELANFADNTTIQQPDFSSLLTAGSPRKSVGTNFTPGPRWCCSSMHLGTSAHISFKKQINFPKSLPAKFSFCLIDQIIIKPIIIKKMGPLLLA